MCYIKLMEKFHNFIWQQSEKSDAKREKKFKDFKFDNCKVIKNIRYGTKKDYNLFDYYYPINYTKSLPIIINLHGGGYVSGKKELNRLISEFWASKGFCVICPNYTLVKKEKFPEPILDVFKLFNYITTNFSRNKFDLNNIFLAGNSAGAHIGSLAVCILNSKTLQQKYKVKSTIKIKACAFSSGIFHLINLYNITPLSDAYKNLIIGENYKNNPLSNYFSAIDLVNEKFPPCFCVSELGDISLGHTKKFCKTLKSLKVDVKLELTNGSHCFNVTNPTTKKSKKVNEAIIDFFKIQMFNTKNKEKKVGNIMKNDDFCK